MTLQYKKCAPDDNVADQNKVQKDAYPNKYIVYSLYGNDPVMIEGAKRNIEMAPQYYPGWKVRIYTDETPEVPEHKIADGVVEEMRALGGEVVQIPDDMREVAGRFWRFLAADDPDVDLFISRDVDSRLSMRERSAVDEFLKSEKSIHIMRDHNAHKAPVMAGMFGLKSGKLPFKMKEEILDYRKTFPELKTKKGDDQRFLQRRVFKYFKAQDDIISHDSFWCVKYKALAFPFPRRGKEYVGQKFRADNTPGTGLKQDAPVECRGKPHWIRG